MGQIHEAVVQSNAGNRSLCSAGSFHWAGEDLHVQTEHRNDTKGGGRVRPSKAAVTRRGNAKSSWCTYVTNSECLNIDYVH